MRWPPDCLYCFLSSAPAVPLWRSGAAGWQTSRGGNLITWSPWGVKTAPGRLRQTADNKRKVVCSWLQTTAISFIPRSELSLAVHWPEREGYLTGAPASSYTCIHTSSAGNYLMSHHTCSCVLVSAGTRTPWVCSTNTGSGCQNRRWSSGLGACGYFQIWDALHAWLIKIPRQYKPPPRQAEQIKMRCFSTPFFFNHVATFACTDLKVL